MEKVCEYCSSSVLDLESLRDEFGFIDLTKLNLKFPLWSKEKLGNQKRIKNWVQFQNQKVLIKSAFNLGDQKNYGIYAELIVEEIGKFLNIPMAHYDLVKLKDIDGNEVWGVMSYIIYNDEIESLMSVHDFIGEEPSTVNSFLDSTDYYFCMKKLDMALSKGDILDKRKVMMDFMKRQAFSILMLETDKHIENYSFIVKENSICLSPNYDSEASLLLDNDVDTIAMLLEDYYALKKVTKIAQPRIGLTKKREDGGLDCFWMDTLEALIIEDDVYNYCVNVLAKEIDMDMIFHNVEQRIKASLPEKVKLISKYAYLCRLEEFRKILDGTI